MINKKGDGHVDWIISIGIFLVYLLGMFVLIKPGVMPVYDYDTLLDIVEEHFKEDVKVVKDGDILTDFGGLYWTLYKTPLFVESVPSVAAKEERCIKIDFPYELENINGEINAYRIDPNKIVSKEKFIPINIRIGSNSLYLEDSITFSSNSEYIIYFSGNGIYNQNLIYDNGNGIIGVSGDISIDESKCVDIGDGLIYNLGIIEKLRGLSEKVLVFLMGTLKDTSKETYEQIKGIYGYPKSKEFSVIATIDINRVYKYKVLEPDVKTNVYTREWGDFILNYDGTRTPIKINLKVW